MTWSNY